MIASCSDPFKLKLQEALLLKDFIASYSSRNQVETQPAQAQKGLGFTGFGHTGFGQGLELGFFVFTGSAGVDVTLRDFGF